MANSVNITTEAGRHNIFDARQKPVNFVETARHTLAVLNTFEGLIQRFSLSKLGMTDTDFELAKAGSIPGTIEHLEAFGVAARLREKLQEMGWQPPQTTNRA
ncbi:MAG: hypothetical protein ACRECY_05970 [Phyllobacterium sp.]